MADWTKEADYPFDKDTPLAEWAWEFLRRNPSYRADFSEWQQRIEALKKDDPSGWKNSPEARVLVPEPLPGENMGPWAFRCADNGEKARILSLEQFYAERWGLKGRLADPDKPWNKRIQFLPHSPYPRIIITEADVWGIVSEHETENGGSVVAVRDGVALIAIDLTANLDRQFRTAKNLLADNLSRLPPAPSTHSGRNRMDKWKRYLRVLDAEAVNAATHDIGVTLDPNDRWNTRHPGPTVKQWLEEARNLRDTGYRAIAAGPQ